MKEIYEYIAEKAYSELLTRGFLWEYYPECIGSWVVDKELFKKEIKKIVQVGRLTASEQVEIKESKAIFVNSVAMGRPVSDRVFFMGLVRMYANGGIK